MVGWLATFFIALTMNVIAYVLAPKPKQPKPEAAKQSETPIADASRPLPVIFGTEIIKEVNVLHWTDRAMQSFEIEA